MAEEVPVAIPRLLFSKEVIVKVPFRENQMKICYSANEHTHEMLRTREEPVGNVLRRISIKVDQILRGSSKKKKALRVQHHDPHHLAEVKLLFGGEPVDENTPNSFAWVEGAVLQVGMQESTVRVNPPTVTSLEVTPYCMVGHAVVAKVEMEFADMSRSLWTWKRCDKTDENSAFLSAPTFWPVIGNEYVYWPTLFDVGHKLLVECTPVNSSGKEGYARTCFTKEVICPPAAEYPFAKRHAFTSRYTDADRLRVVSYNILADVYASSDHARENLYSYCTHHSVDPLDIEYRQCLIESELLGYHSDVICLQELGERCYSQYLRPVLEQKGYSCHYKMKEGQVLEGVGILLRRAKLVPLEEVGISFTEFLLKDPSANGLLHQLRNTPRLLSFLAGKHSVILIVIAKVISESLDMETNSTEETLTRDPKSPPVSCYVAVANTHLYYHPEGDHIRLLQAHIGAMILRKVIDGFQQKMAAKGEGDYIIAPIFAGDFNSSPLNGVYEYFVNGEVTKEHHDWTVAAVYEETKYRKHLQWLAEKESKQSIQGTVRKEENSLDVLPSLLAEANIPEPRTIFNNTSDLPHPEVFPGLALQHSFRFLCASGLPMYTNFTKGFVDTLDYIYVDHTHLEPEGDGHFPSHSDVTENVALPSYKFPSDHLALISDLKWKHFSMNK